MPEVKNSGYYIDDHALLFAWLACAVLRSETESGASLIENWVTSYGRERGARSARRCLQDGQPLTVQNYYVYSEWQDERGWNANEIIEFAPYHIRTTSCGWCSSWKKHGLLDFGKLYCKWVDPALAYGFNPDLVLEMSGILSEGHGHCDFKWPGSLMTAMEFNNTAARRKALAGRVTRDFFYHGCHLYDTLVRVLVGRLGMAAARTILEQGLGDYAACYGPEKAREIAKKCRQDYTRV